MWNLQLRGKKISTHDSTKSFFKLSFHLVLFDYNWQELIQILFGRDFTLIPGLERINGLRYILQWRELLRKDRVGESVTSRDIYKMHLIATKLPSVKYQAAPHLKVFQKNYSLLSQACTEWSGLSIFYRPVDFTFLKVDLDQSLVRQVADLVGVASHQPSIILALVAFKDHDVRTPILFQSCRFCDVCYTSSGIFCEKKVYF